MCLCFLTPQEQKNIVPLSMSHEPQKLSKQPTLGLKNKCLQPGVKMFHLPVKSPVLTILSLKVQRNFYYMLA